MSKSDRRKPDRARSAERQQRLAEQLRANLKKRKQQMRSRKVLDGDPSRETGDVGIDADDPQITENQ